MEDIAVVGIGLRFPGDASCPEELWDILERGESQWSEFPKDRLNIDGYFHPSGDRQGSISFRGAHFLKGDFASFDAPFFSVAAEDAKAIDPQQRILLEASYEALENAGIRKEDVDGSDAAVYVGSFVKDYEQVCLRDPDWQPQYAATGNGIAIMANRISYFFNLHGPSMTIDTGCSGSLVAVHLAVQSLRNNETSMAIAAGAGMILAPNTIMPMTALNFLSPDGKCFTFDARANGYGRGEGIGVVILKRMSDALQDNDTIRAVIRGTRVNQDGHTTGITLPSKEAQVANIRAVYKSAGLDFDQTAYVECHGTGTQAGDWRELKAISESLASNRSIGNPIVVGSIKPNIGHLEGAAGVAGLIKGVLTLEKGKIPPNINFERGNPGIDFEDWRVKVPTKMLNWPLSGLRRVSVNCFGFGGTNAHVIMDEVPRYLSHRGLKGNHNSFQDELLPNENQTISINPSLDHTSSSFDPQVLCYSSHEKAGIQRVMKSHLPYLASKSNNPSHDLMRHYSYTLGCRRSELEWKSFIVASSLNDLTSKLQATESITAHRTSKTKQPRLCFVFSGQGAQWAQMGKDLLPFEAFRDSLEAAATYFKIKFNSHFDLLKEILKEPDESRISDPEIAQPATTALQVALVDLLDSFMVVPQYVVGHSSGEIAASYASGGLCREMAWEVAYHRGLAVSAIPSKDPRAQGAMLVVGMSHSEVKAFLKDVKSPVEVACLNSPRSTTLSGDAEDVEAIRQRLSKGKIFHRLLPVRTAYHSSHMKLVENDYRSSLGRITTRDFPPNARMYSSVTGQAIRNFELNGNYWVKNMTMPVRYIDAVESLMGHPVEERPDMIIELSPAATLKSPTLDILSDQGRTSLPSYHSILDRKSHGAISLLNTVGELWIRGYPVDMKKVVSQGSYQASLKVLTDLPPYPWNHAKSYWHESHLGRANRFRDFGRQDLIGAPTADAISFEPRWRGFLRISENPWIQDHQVQKTIVYPAAGMVSMVLEGASQVTKDEVDILGYEITNMRIEKAMIIPNTTHGLETAMNFKRGTGSNGVLEHGQSFEFTIYSKQLDAPWEQHASGLLRIQCRKGGHKPKSSFFKKVYKDLEAVCTEALVPRQLYELLDIVGMNYGTLFQNITKISRGENACVSKVRVPNTRSKMPAKFEYPHLIHPATLDSMFQTLFAIDNEPMVPTFVNSIFVSADITREIGSEFSGYAIANRTGIRDASARIVMAQSDWDHPSVVIDGLHFTGISTPSPKEGGFLPNHRNLCTEIIWEEDITSTEPKDLEMLVTLLSHKYPGIAILQIGGSSGLMTRISDILLGKPDKVSPVSRYTVADGYHKSTEDVLTVAQGTPLEKYVEKRAINGSESLPNYHLIFVCDDTGIEASNFHKHLNSGGFLLVQCCDSVGDDTASRYEITVGEDLLQFSQYRKPIPLEELGSMEVVVLLPDNALPDTEDLVLDLKRTAGNRSGIQVATIRAAEVCCDSSCVKGKLVISLLDFSIEGHHGSVFHWDESGFYTFHSLQKVAQGIIWITKSSHKDTSNPYGAPVLALARTLMSEDPLKTIVTLDIGPRTNIDDVKVANAVITVLINTFCTHSTSGPRETEYAEECGKLFVPRLKPISALNRLVEYDGSNEIVEMSFDSSGNRFRLNIAKPGLEDGSLFFSEVDSSGPGVGEVEVVFSSATITHCDLETIMGRSVNSHVGMDIVGSIKRVGAGVSDFRPGDRVAGLVSDGAFQSTKNIDARFVKKSLSEIPLSHYVSAGYALLRDRHSPGRSVLIHAGASSFGLAAVEFATSIGCKVYATVMGADADQQRAILLARGLPSNRVLDGDSGGFVHDIRDQTGARGVDIVYNSTQEHVESNFRCVRKCGLVFQFSSKLPGPPVIRACSSASFIAFDLLHLLREDPDGVAEMLDRTAFLVPTLRSKLYMRPAETTVFDLPLFKDAFTFVEKSPYLGRTSIRSSPRCRVPVATGTRGATKPLHESLVKDKTYVLAGGLGGLGRSICELLIKNGAKHIAFLSRSGASSGTARAFMKGLLKQGVNARVFQVDVCDKAALDNVVRKMSSEMPPIQGVFQCAAVIKDAVFDNMSYSDWIAAFKPKTVGSNNLMQTIGGLGRDIFFVFLASSAGVIGTRGQANYAAGNCFEDALARYYRQTDRHAVSIDLGPVLGAGMLADDEEILDMLRASGFYGIRHQDFLTMITHAITAEIAPGIPMPPQVIMGVGTGGIIQQNQPADPYWSRTALYSYLNIVDVPPPDLSAVGGSNKNPDMKSMLACCADTSAASEIITTGLSHMLAKAMNMLPEEIDAGKPLNVYGVDSLVAVGIRNWVLSNCGVQVSVFEVLSDKTIAELAADIATKGGFNTDKDE